MAELTRGTVTFLFTDIQGSTQLARELRDRWADALHDHQALLRAAFQRHGGREIDTQGDAFFVAFAHASDAVLAAVDGQRALAEHEWPGGAELRVRMGIHTGQARTAGDRYVGLAVHRAARVAAAAHGGQILVSETTRGLLEDEEEELPGIELRSVGSHLLKDFDRPVPLYRIRAAGLPEFVRAPRTGADRRTRRATVVAVAGTLLTAAVATGAVFTATQGDDAVTAEPNSVAVIDPDENRIVDQVRVGIQPGPIAFSNRMVWVANVAEKTLSRIRSSTLEETRIPLEGTPTGVAVGGRTVWVVHGLTGSVVPIDAASNTRGEPIDIGGGRNGAITVRGESVWATFEAGSIVARIDPTGGRVVRGYAGTRPSAIAAGEGAIWVANHGANTVSHFNPASFSGGVGPIGEVTVGAHPVALAAGGRSVWVVNRDGDSVTRIDPDSKAVEDTIEVGDGPTGIAVGAGAVWVANADAGTVTRIDARTGDVLDTIEVGNRPSGVAVGARLVWITVQAP